MPHEIRRIVFTYLEATEAITAYGNKNNMAFANGNIIRANFLGKAEYTPSLISGEQPAKEQKKAVIVTFYDPKTLEHKYFNLTSDFVITALIEYCILHKIALPKTAVKSLDITEFNMVLDLANHLGGSDDTVGTKNSLTLED